MINDQLKKLGFNKAETSAYLTLLELGQSRANDLIEKTKTHRNLVYKALHSLEDKNLVTKTIVSGVAEFSANSLNYLLEDIENKKAVIKTAVEELAEKNKQNESSVEEDCLDELKKVYLEIQKKYSLPDFDKLNEDFNIEKLADVETEYLIREIRKFMADKFSNYLRFIETILNPVNAQVLVFTIIKTLGSAEKEILSEIYKKLAKKEVELIELDIQFSEEREAEFVKDSFAIWQGMKKDLLQIIGVIKKNWNNKVESNGKNYFFSGEVHVGLVYSVISGVGSLSLKYISLSSSS